MASLASKSHYPSYKGKFTIEAWQVDFIVFLKPCKATIFLALGQVYNIGRASRFQWFPKLRKATKFFQLGQVYNIGRANRFK